jgi:beta-lactam-binding protein with PASTA domain
MTLRQRLHWLLRMSLLLFILASVAFLSALTAMRYAVQGREVVVPDVTGKRSGEAQYELQALGIGMKIEDRIYSPRAADEVVRQSPPPSMTVKKGQFAHVVLSLGARRETVPQIEDRSVRAAKVELLQTGMQVGEISSVYLSDTPDDLVLQQDPPPGTTDAATPHENFLISLGPRPAAYVMPDLVGLPLNQAIAKLNGAGLKIAKIATSSQPPSASPSPAPTSSLDAPPPGSTADSVTATLPSTSKTLVVSETPGRGHLVDANTMIALQVTQ